ncbi:MAG: Cro/CI family transcriptional regulator [Gammaproteobacteria bacterium]
MNSEILIDRAIATCGGKITVFAKQVGVTHQAVSKWRRFGVPAERAMQIEIATGGAVTRQELRPDIFGDLPRPAAQPPEAAPAAPEPPAEGVEAPCPLQRAPDAILWSDEAA